MRNPSRPRRFLTCDRPAVIRYLAWLLHIQSSSSLWLVFVCLSHLPQYIMVAPQRHWMDEKQAIPLKKGQPDLHILGARCATILDT